MVVYILLLQANDFCNPILDEMLLTLLGLHLACGHNYLALVTT